MARTSPLISTQRRDLIDGARRAFDLCAAREDAGAEDAGRGTRCGHRGGMHRRGGGQRTPERAAGRWPAWRMQASQCPAWRLCECRHGAGRHRRAPSWATQGAIAGRGKRRRG
jgi:hypothetical protein